MPEETQTESTGTTTTTNNAGATTDTTPAKGGQQPGEAKFTQADVDRIVGERAQRAAEAATNKLLETLGVKSADELKTVMDAARRRDEADLTEQQRKDKALEKANQERDALQKQLDTEREARKQEKVDSIVRAAAKNAHDANSVLLEIRANHAEALAKVLKDDGTPDERALNDLMSKVKKDRPFLFSGGPGSPSNAGGRTPDPDAVEEQAARDWLNRLRS